MTTQSHPYPSRVEVNFDGKLGWVVLDQIRTVDKTRLVKKIGKMGKEEISKVKRVIHEMLVE